MILKECYYVCYYTADFSNDGKSTNHEDFYLIYSNALMVAKELTKCLDVVDGYVSIVSGLTGEVLAEFSADEAIIPTAEITEEETASTIGGTFKDKNGDNWHLTDDGKWDYDCTGQNCSDCVYRDKGGRCEITDPLYEEDRNYQIERAKKRLAETNNLSTNIDSFEDGLGGTWRRNDDNSDWWSYDCDGIKCDECPYNWGSGPCYTDSMYIDSVKTLIAETKERIGK